MKYLLVLTASLLIHAATYFLAYQIPAAPEWSSQEPIAFEILTPRKQMVLDSYLPDQLKTDKGNARFFSKNTQRVKTEMKASKTGLTKNSFEPPKKRIPRQDPLQEKSKTSRYGLLRNAPVLTEVPETNPFSFSQVNEDLPEDVTIGAITALNTDQHVFYSFYSRITKKLRFGWERNVRNALDYLEHRGAMPAKKMAWASRVGVVLDPKGYLHDVQVFHSCGISDLDQAAVDAFKTSTPYLNPPVEMVQDDGLIHIEFGFSVRYSPRYLASPN